MFLCKCGYNNRFTDDTICMYCGEKYYHDDTTSGHSEAEKIIVEIFEGSGFKSISSRTFSKNEIEIDIGVPHVPNGWRSKLATRIFLATGMIDITNGYGKLYFMKPSDAANSADYNPSEVPINYLEERQ